MSFWRYIAITVIVGLLSGCASPKMYNKTYRREILLQMYPPKITSREDVHKKLRSSKSDLQVKRPTDGWAYHSSKHLAQRIQNIEKRNSTEILHVERYMLPDPRSSFDFLSLCNIWFYYDVEDKVVDVEWEYQSD